MKKRVLILNCGTLASIDINMSLRYDDEFEIWGASTNKNHGIYIYKNYIDDIPSIKEENFIDVLNNKIKEYNFKFIFAPHEDLALFLQEHKDEIKATSISNDEKLKNKIRKERNINCFSSNNVEVLLDWKA